MRSHIGPQGKTRWKIQQLQHDAKLLKSTDNIVSETIYLLERLRAETESVAGNFHYLLHSFRPLRKRLKALKPQPQPASSDCVSYFIVKAWLSSRKNNN